jgi:MoxR-like ATPase
MNTKMMVKENMLLAAAMPKSGVVYLEGRPGEGKSSIIRSIAQKTNRKFFDIRLSQMDETDIGLFPFVDTNEKCLNYVVPRWAVEANKQPSIILFDELNRAQLPIRNAALQILLDRKIGWDFLFNDDVLFFAAGNVGESDGCDVEEFDAALWGRLIHVKHSLTIDEWIDGFAKENVWEVVVSYLKAFPQELYKRN